MTEVSDTLRQALALIEKPENWCKEWHAMGADGALLLPESPDACRWCIESAVAVVLDLDWSGTAEVLRRLARAIPGHRQSPHAVIDFNDHPDTTHPMVVDLFKRAIAEEEANG